MAKNTKKWWRDMRFASTWKERNLSSATRRGRAAALGTEAAAAAPPAAPPPAEGRGAPREERVEETPRPPTPPPCRGVPLLGEELACEAALEEEEEEEEAVPASDMGDRSGGLLLLLGVPFAELRASLKACGEEANGRPPLPPPPSPLGAASTPAAWGATVNPALAAALMEEA